MTGSLLTIVHAINCLQRLLNESMQKLTRSKEELQDEIKVYVQESARHKVLMDRGQQE